MSGESSALIQLGFVGAPFGVRGWIKLRSHTDPPERLLEHRSLRIGRGDAWQSYRIEASGRSGGALTVKLTGVEDRDQAQALRGAQVCVARSELPQRDDKDFYRADLIGCEVVNLDGIGLGHVQHFIESPAQVLMVVRGAQEFWIPAVPQYLRRVDLTARRVVVDWNAATGSGAPD
jgi:16S rRNA processing protein RimM